MMAETAVPTFTRCGRQLLHAGQQLGEEDYEPPLSENPSRVHRIRAREHCGYHGIGKIHELLDVLLNGDIR